MFKLSNFIDWLKITPGTNKRPFTSKIRFNQFNVDWSMHLKNFRDDESFEVWSRFELHSQTRIKVTLVPPGMLLV